MATMYSKNIKLDTVNFLGDNLPANLIRSYPL